MSSAARVKQSIKAAKFFAANRQIEKEKIYLCNWYVKLVKPGKQLPRDVVQCHVPMKMNKLNIKDYFQNIYKVKVNKVDTRIQLGKTKLILPHRVMTKKPDYKVAYITLQDETFKFPDLFSKYEQRRQEELGLDTEATATAKQLTKKQKELQGGKGGEGEGEGEGETK